MLENVRTYGGAPARCGPHLQVKSVTVKAALAHVPKCPNTRRGAGMTFA